MGIYALQTARNGSISVPRKNIAQIRGKPLYRHNIDYINKSVFVEKIFTTTDIPSIIEEEDDSYEVIQGPVELYGDNAAHIATIQHGLLEIEKRTGEEVDILVIVFGNTLGARPQDVDAALSAMIQDETIDSCQSVSEYNMFTPIRAMKEDENGFLTSIIDQKVIEEMSSDVDLNHRDAIGNAYFFNGSFWICRREAIMQNDGLLPFPWLGRKIKSIRQPTIMEIDAPWQLKWLESGLGFSNWPFVD